MTLTRGPIAGYQIQAAPAPERERTIRGAQLQAMLCLQARDERALSQVLLHRGRDGRTVARAIAEAWLALEAELAERAGNPREAERERRRVEGGYVLRIEDVEAIEDAAHHERGQPDEHDLGPTRRVFVWEDAGPDLGLIVVAHERLSRDLEDAWWRDCSAAERERLLAEERAFYEREEQLEEQLAAEAAGQGVGAGHPFADEIARLDAEIAADLAHVKANPPRLAPACLEGACDHGECPELPGEPPLVQATPAELEVLAAGGPRALAEAAARNTLAQAQAELAAEQQAALDRGEAVPFLAPGPWDHLHAPRRHTCPGCGGDTARSAPLEVAPVADEERRVVDVWHVACRARARGDAPADPGAAAAVLAALGAVELREHLAGVPVMQPCPGCGEQVTSDRTAQLDAVEHEGRTAYQAWHMRCRIVRGAPAPAGACDTCGAASTRHELARCAACVHAKGEAPGTDLQEQRRARALDRAGETRPYKKRKSATDPPCELCGAAVRWRETARACAPGSSRVMHEECYSAATGGGGGA